MVFRNQEMVLDVLITTGMSMLQSLEVNIIFVLFKSWVDNSTPPSQGSFSSMFHILISLLTHGFPALPIYLLFALSCDVNKILSELQYNYHYKRSAKQFQDLFILIFLLRIYSIKDVCSVCYVWNLLRLILFCVVMLSMC